MIESIAALNGIIDVSRETGEKLESYVALIRKWQRAENLISPKTLPELWTRHIADCAQIVSLFPDTRVWLDMGTGAGLPGMVVALLAPEGSHVHLVESNTRKCAFLRTVIRETGAPATVHEGRAEKILSDWDIPVDRVIARALASLSELFRLAEPLMARGVRAGFHKGDDFRREVSEASQSWAFDLVECPSRVAEGSVILDIGNLSRVSRPVSADRSK